MILQLSKELWVGPTTVSRRPLTSTLDIGNEDKNCLTASRAVIHLVAYVINEIIPIQI